MNTFFASSPSQIFLFLKLQESETYKFLTVFWYFATVDMFGARYHVSLQINL